MFILVLLLILNGQTYRADVIARTPSDTAQDQKDCETAGKQMVEKLGVPPPGMHAEFRCAHVDAPPAAKDAPDAPTAPAAPSSDL